jgi:excinuclease ABC subunit C
MIPKNLVSTIKNLPKKPGVYRYYGLDGSLLYVGKAKNLKNRVSSYFQEGRPQNQRISLMVSQIRQIEYTVVDSEMESLLLEANLINSLQPKYNIALKDDRSYCYIRLTNDEIPGFFVVRNKFDPQSTYFGPYASRYTVEEILRTLRIIFPFCQAKKAQTSPCGYVGLGQCDGLCIGKEEREDYLEKLEQIKKVLLGKTESAEAFLTSKIQQAVKEENYPLAALWKERLGLLKRTVQSRKVILPSPQDVDLVSLVMERSPEGLQLGSVFVQQIRGGRMINVNNFLLTGSEVVSEQVSPEENYPQLAQRFLIRFLSNYYTYQTELVPVLVQCFASESGSD